MASNKEVYELIISNAAKLWDVKEYYRIQEENTFNSQIDHNKVQSQADFLKNLIAQAGKDV